MSGGSGREAVTRFRRSGLPHANNPSPGREVGLCAAGRLRAAPGAAFTLRRRITALDNGGATDPFAVLNEI
jgi:hypothetical protein